MTIETYPQKISVNGFKLDNPPEWCAMCKKQINPGDPYKMTQSFVTCQNDKCYEATVHHETYPHEGVRFFNQLLQHTAFVGAQKVRMHQGLPYHTWLEWCEAQDRDRKTIMDHGGSSMVVSYVKTHGSWPDKFKQ